MKIVILQGELNTIDITRDDLVKEWNDKLSVVDGIEYIILRGDYRKPPEEVSNEIPADADAVFGLRIASTHITEAFLQSHPKVKYIAGLAHGFGDVDFELTRKYGVTITNTAYGDSTIAEYAIALLLAGCHRVEAHSDYLKTTKWWELENQGRGGHMRTLVPQIELFGKTIGIVGLGKIGACTGRIARGFGMTVLGNSRRIKTGAEYEGIEQVSLDELYARSDIISVHVPFSLEAKEMFNSESFAKMKDGVMFINTARGGLVDEEALADALDSGKVSYAGLDVLTDEPPKAPSRLLNHPNAVITGHIAWLPRTSRMRQVSLAISNYLAYLSGNPVSVINAV